MENAEINNIIKIVGLQYKKSYDDPESLRSLRYGKIMIMTDQVLILYQSHQRLTSRIDPCLGIFIINNCNNNERKASFIQYACSKPCFVEVTL